MSSILKNANKKDDENSIYAYLDAIIMPLDIDKDKGWGTHVIHLVMFLQESRNHKFFYIIWGTNDRIF